MAAYGHFFAVYAASIIIAVYVGLRLMGVSIRTSWKPSIAFARRHYLMLIVLAALPLAVQALSLAKTFFGDTHYVTESINNASKVYALGGGIITTLQRSLDSAIIDAFFGVTYMWVFAVFTYLLPILLVVKRDGPILANFTIAVGMNYVVLIIFYILFPVKVSSGLPGANVEPVLYSSDTWSAMATSVDSLTNCFPSGHVSLSFTAFLVFALAGVEYRRLSYILGATAVILGIAVLHLGIHYPADVLGGLVLAAFSVFCATNERVREAVTKFFFSPARAEVDNSV